MDDDPFYWDTDRVVRELCTEDRTWISKYPSSSLPDSKEFEQTLRMNEVDGFGLLYSVDNTETMKEFGLKNFMQRRALTYAIKQLQDMSPKYSGKNPQPPVTPHNSLPNEHLEALPADRKRLADEVLDETEAKKLKTDQRVVPIFAVDLDRNGDAPLVTSPDDQTPIQQDQPDDDIAIPDPVVQVTTPSEPGRVFIDESGRKRLQLVTNIPQSKDTSDNETLEEEQELDTSKSLILYGKSQADQEKEILAQGWAGKEKMPVDDIFYGEGLMGSHEAGGLDNYVVQKIISPGRRLYVNSVVKKFLLKNYPCQTRKKFFRNGKTYSAILPYPAGLLPDGQDQSFTLLSWARNGEILLTKEMVSKWPEVATLTLSKTRAFDKNKFDSDALAEKYSNVPGGEVVLPVFGESDSEDEMDDVTWGEMEKEYMEKHRKPLEKATMLSRRAPLSLEQVESAVDEAIADLEFKWRTTKMPKLATKEWDVFQKHRRMSHQVRKARKKYLQREVSHINDDRIPSLRREILSEVWTRPERVRKQAAGSMEVSIFDREKNLWLLAVLQRRTPPPKPATMPPKVKKEESTTHLAGGEELILSESEPEDISDDNLDDFIVDWDGDDDDYVDAAMEDGDDESSDSSDATVRSGKKVSRSAAASADAANLSPSALFTPRTPGSVGSRATRSSKAVMIDLTMTSDSSPGSSKVKQSGSTSSQPVDLTTPQKRSAKRLFVKNNGTLKPALLSSPMAISSDSDGNFAQPAFEEPVSAPDADDELPPYTEPQKIAAIPWHVLEGEEDRERLVIAYFYKTAGTQIIRSEFQTQTEADMWNTINNVLHAMFYHNGPGERKADLAVEGMDVGMLTAYISIIRGLKIYIDCKWRGPWIKNNHKHVEVNLGLVQELETSKDRFHEIYELIQNIAQYFPVDQVDEDGLNGKRKKRVVIENQDAKALREANKERLEQQRLRRLELQRKMATEGNSTTSDSSRIIINLGKHDDEGFIYIDETIGKRIKAHQIAGVRFMWDQVVTDATNMQGCLLAHTMGLGKTMQVITLLVAIAEAAKSEDDSVVKQIPERLRVSRTLVLCPPGLVDNWEDELLTWAPQKTLGDPLKIAALAPLEQRLSLIQYWYDNGGVLIIGYEMFRTLIANKASKGKDPPLDEETIEILKKQLLEGPSIIIADEAHKLKNRTVAISVLARQFTSHSRIALTGSPLNNNLVEYYSMIDWVAPNYLGPITEFNAKYVVPIESGLYLDSLDSEKKRSKRTLAALHADLELKMNRANMSVLKDVLPPKKEFVIRLALTNLQKEVYTLYVRHMRGSSALDYVPTTKKGGIFNATLWSWLSVLSLLCNHPACFKDKLADIRNANQSGMVKSKDLSAHTSDDERGGQEEEDPEVPILAGAAIVQANSDNSMAELLNSVPDIRAVELSSKMLIVTKILDESKKVNDQVLIFTQSLPTLDFIENVCRAGNRSYHRLDGTTQMAKRQTISKEFNAGLYDILLISTQAGGLGLNFFAGNRVIIFDFKYNPTQEEQAVGRAYRIGQLKPVFVYRFVMAGTFEEKVENRAVYKMQLASRVVDKETPVAWAKKAASEYLVDPEEVEQRDLTIFHGEDPNVLDKLLNDPSIASSIRDILKTDTFAEADNEDLDDTDKEEIEALKKEAQLQRAGDQAELDKFKKERAQRLRKKQREDEERKAEELREKQRKQLEASKSKAAKESQASGEESSTQADTVLKKRLKPKMTPRKLKKTFKVKKTPGTPKKTPEKSKKQAEESSTSDDESSTKTSNVLKKTPEKSKKTPEKPKKQAEESEKQTKASSNQAEKTEAEDSTETQVEESNKQAEELRQQAKKPEVETTIEAQIEELQAEDPQPVAMSSLEAEQLQYNIAVMDNHLNNLEAMGKIRRNKQAVPSLIVSLDPEIQAQVHPENLSQLPSQGLTISPSPGNLTQELERHLPELQTPSAQSIPTADGESTSSVRTSQIQPPPSSNPARDSSEKL